MVTRELITVTQELFIYILFIDETSKEYPRYGLWWFVDVLHISAAKPSQEVVLSPV